MSHTNVLAATDHNFRQDAIQVPYSVPFVGPLHLFSYKTSKFAVTVDYHIPSRSTFAKQSYTRHSAVRAMGSPLNRT